jgi:hypothetical protein
MKLNEIVDYKGIGTIQMLKDEDGKKFYRYRHNYFGEYSDDDTIKAAKEMLEWEDTKASEIRKAIYTLQTRGYKVYKEMA